LRTQQGRSAAQVGNNAVGSGVVDEVGSARQVRQTEARRIERHAGDVQGRLAGFVERQLELIAAQQVDAVERRVLRGGGDLRQDAVELVHQVAANRLRRRIDHGG
jgi:hypothetical protein